MHSFKLLALGLSAGLLVACGGGGNGDQSPKVSYSSLVSFGDSLSDVGSYKVGTIAALGGGKWTVNSATDKNWTELIAAQIGVAAPCAAQTGLNGDVDYGFLVPVVNHTTCRNYAQGGSRVTEAAGPGNGTTMGALTIPLVTQIANHLGVVGNTFSGSELVTVMAGANDVFMNLAVLNAGGQDATAAVTAMATAGATLGAYVKTQLVAKGAKHVVVLNIPDIVGTPFGSTLSAPGQALVNAMVTNFNTQLRTSLAGTNGVLFIDAYTASKDETANPSQYGLTNVAAPACNLAYGINELATVGNSDGSSLVCRASNLIAGDTSRYLFADGVHLTPYGYKLLAQLVTKELVLAGWL